MSIGGVLPQLCTSRQDRRHRMCLLVSAFLFCCCGFLSAHSQFKRVPQTGSVSSFTGAVFAGDTSVAITLTGVGLSAAPSTGSVSSIRFEAASTCTTTPATSNVVVTPSTLTVSGPPETSLLIAALPPGGLPNAGSWSVCVAWSAQSPVPSYSRVYAPHTVTAGV